MQVLVLSIAPCFRSPMLNEEMMRPGQFFVSLRLSFLQWIKNGWESKGKESIG